MAKKLLILGFACYLQLSHAMVCTYGEELVIQKNYKFAVEVLNECLKLPEIVATKKRRALEVRAFSYWSLGDPGNAVSDHEAANVIALPTSQNEYRESINYAMYLREAKMAIKSLEVLQKVVLAEAKSDQLSMPTQYHLGLTLQELGCHEEAVLAFRRGLTVQSDYAFAHYRIGLSLEALNIKEASKNYFAKAAALINGHEGELNLGKESDAVISKLKEYGLSLKSPKVKSLTE